MSEVIIVKDEAEAGAIYARAVANLIKAKPNAVLGLATGSSPLAAYQALATAVKEESLDVSQVRGFALDEYLGLPLDHPQSYHSTIHRTVVEPLGLDPAKVHVPGDVLNGAPVSEGTTIADAGPAYDQAIAQAASTYKSWASAPTDTSASTNRDPRWPRARASKRWRNKPASTTHASSTTT